MAVMPQREREREREREKELGKHKIATAEMNILGTPHNTRCFATKGIRTFRKKFKHVQICYKSTITTTNGYNVSVEWRYQDSCMLL